MNETSLLNFYYVMKQNKNIMDEEYQDYVNISIAQYWEDWNKTIEEGG